MKWFPRTIRNEEYLALGERLREELPPRAVAEYEMDLSAGERKLAVDQIYNFLQVEEDLTISQELADEIWRFAEYFGITRWNREELQRYVRD